MSNILDQAEDPFCGCCDSCRDGFSSGSGQVLSGDLVEGLGSDICCFVGAKSGRRWFHDLLSCASAYAKEFAAKGMLVTK